MTVLFRIFGYNYGWKLEGTCVDAMDLGVFVKSPSSLCTGLGQR